MSTLVLLFFVLARAFTSWLLWLVPVYYCIAYRQLFGVGIPGLFIIFLVVLFIGYWIGKRQAARRKS